MNPKTLLVCSLFVWLAQAARTQNWQALSSVQLDSMATVFLRAGEYDKAEAATLERLKRNPQNDSLYVCINAELARIYADKGDYAKSELLLQKLLKDAPQGGFLRALVLMESALLNVELARYEAAYKQIEEAQSIFIRLNRTNGEEYIRCLTQMGKINRAMGNLTEAEELSLEVKAIYAQNNRQPDVYYSVNLDNLAQIYVDMGAFDQTSLLYSEMKELTLKQHGKWSDSYADILNNLAVAHVRKGDFKQSEVFFREALEVYAKIVGKSHVSYGRALVNLANMHYYAGQYDKAGDMYEQAKKIYLQTLGRENPNYADYLGNMALLSIETQDFAKAERLYRESLDIQKRIFGEKHLTCARTLNNILYVQAVSGDTTGAWQTALAALDICAGGLSLEPVINQAWIDKVRGANYPTSAHGREALNTLDYLHLLYLSMQDGADHSRELEDLSNLGLELVRNIQVNLVNESDKLTAMSFNGTWVQKALQAMNGKKQADRAFALFELNKGVLLQQALQSDRGYSMGYLPDSLYEKEQQMGKEQGRLQALMLESGTKEKKDSLLAAINRLSIEIKNFKIKTEKAYPQYAKLKYQQELLQVADLQALLDQETALLEYAVLEGQWHVFYLDKNGLRWDSLKVSADTLQQNIATLHHALSDYEYVKEKPEQAYRDYTASAHWCYKQLVEPALSGGAAGIKHLIIVPDGELAHLPFEAFLAEPADGSGNYSNLHYLLRDYALSYNYSAALWKQNMEAEPRRHNGKLLGMAADYSKKEASVLDLRLPSDRRRRGLLDPLPAARGEVQVLSERFAGEFFFDSMATERRFKAKASDFAAIHLAMHGVLDRKSPILSSLAFTEDGDSTENNFLQAYEISKLKLNADLVVLSACETGYGKVEVGNGTASLARAFMYAGVPALVVSLWEVNDASTSKIMQLFYQYLSEGQDKAQALRSAKLQYLNNSKGLSAHPAFWSAFVQMGDSRPMKLGGKGSGLWLRVAGGLGLLLLGGMVWARLRKKE